MAAFINIVSLTAVWGMCCRRFLKGTSMLIESEAQCNIKQPSSLVSVIPLPTYTPMCGKGLLLREWYTIIERCCAIAANAAKAKHSAKIKNLIGNNGAPLLSAIDLLSDGVFIVICMSCTRLQT